MGCISSKVMSKSVSFKEDLNKSLHRRSKSISSLEELIVPGNKRDQFLALVCTANTVANKIRSESLASESNTIQKTDNEHVSTEKMKAWELGTNLEQGGEQSQTAARLVQSSSSPSPAIDADLARRSKSCHWFPEYEVSSVDGFNEIKEDGSNSSKKLWVRARSIHTVEEYDALLEKIWLSRSRQTGFGDEEASSERNDEDSRKEKISTDTDVLANSGLQTTEANSSPTSSSTKEVLNVVAGDAQVQNITEKGFKRKALAKGLESLSLPQIIEFPNVGSLKDWLEVGEQVHSRRAYVTPKFGSYALPTSGTENRCGGDVAFNPELVAAFEESMQQLEAEEDTVLKQIVDDLEEVSTRDKQGEEREEVPSHLTLQGPM